MGRTELQNRSYLGDGVYVGHDGFSLWLTTENGINVTNEICLEPEVWHALSEYVAARKKAARP